MTNKEIDKIKEMFPQGVLSEADICGTPELTLAPQALMSVCVFLHDEADFEYLEDITAADMKDSIDVIYRLFNINTKEMLALRVKLYHETPSIESVTGIWSGADWQEREIYDLMGVEFANHPNLKRILLPDDWEGHPLRKDYVIKD